jgi:EAL and modified HD-GYP domain-containing signal transduction protein
MRYVARQPILNLRGHVHGYDLLFRHAADPTLKASLIRQAKESEPGREDAEMSANVAARTMLDNAVIFGLDWLTNGLPGFVRCSEETLNEDLVLVLEPAKTVLSIPASLKATPRLLDSCRMLKASGFRFSLDDLPRGADGLDLARLSDYIRVDLGQFTAHDRQHLRCPEIAAATLVAKNVETQADYERACAEGFKLFQGSYFCHPVLLKKHKIPANRMLHFDIVRELHHDPLDVRKISLLVQQDGSLTYRLLRLVNSPVYGIHQEVRNIQSAILAVGDNVLRRMVTLAVLSEMGGEAPPEILHMTLVRARFCELAAHLCSLDPSEQYLLGMLSLLPAMLCLPMEELTPSLPLRGEICEALEGTPNQERMPLSWLENHERGAWEQCDAIAHANALHVGMLPHCYSESLVWAASALRSSR